MEVRKITLFKKGDSCFIERKCTKCKKNKHGSEFFLKFKICKDCHLETTPEANINLSKLQKKLERVERWRNKDLGLDYIDKDSPIRLFRSELEWSYEVEYEKVLKLYERGEINVYNKNEVYLLDGENKYLKQKILLDNKFTCHYCGSYGNTIDHIFPQNKGGKWTEDNLICSCQNCNALKGDMLYEDFIKSKIRTVYHKQSKIVQYNKHGIPIRK